MNIVVQMKGSALDRYPIIVCHYYWCKCFQLGSNSQIEKFRVGRGDPRFFRGRGCLGLQNQWGVFPKCCNLRIGIYMVCFSNKGAYSTTPFPLHLPLLKACPIQLQGTTPPLKNPGSSPGSTLAWDLLVHIMYSYTY